MTAPPSKTSASLCPVRVNVNGADIGELVFPDKDSAVVAKDILAGENYPFAKIDKLLGPGAKTAIDVGANAGAFSIAVGLQWPGSTLFAFEPSATAFACLDRNLARFSGTHTFPYGLGLGDHTLTMKTSAFGSPGGSVGDSGVNLADGEAIEIRDAGRTVAELGAAPIDILKIDTEGCELPILKSLASFLEKIKVVFLEYHSEDDRRDIDRLLAATHCLFHAQVGSPHRGDLCFISHALASRWQPMRIVAPACMNR